MDQELVELVKRFLADFWRMRSAHLLLSTRLEEDLGMTGDDAAEFLEAFAERFEVDLTGLEFHKHFGPECGGPILFWAKGLMEEMKDHGNYPVTVAHLIAVAGDKQWSCPPRS